MRPTNLLVPRGENVTFLALGIKTSTKRALAFTISSRCTTAKLDNRFLGVYILTTRRAKRWNGELSSLSVDYLKEVLEKMQAYGVAVQFEFPGHAKMPIYQVINHRGYKMGFDGKHLLHSLNENGNISDQLSAEFSIEQVQQAMLAPVAAPRARKSAGTRARKQAQPEQIEVDKYNYFRENRDWLPDDIQYYSDDISAMMRSGMTAEQAFGSILDEHYE